MPLYSFKQRSLALAAMAAMAVAFVPTAQAQAQGAFSRFTGSWSGSGTISMADGTHERIRCRVHYSLAHHGDALSQDLICASASYKFDVKSDVVAHGDTLSGSWSETTRGVTGELSGRIGRGVIQATVRGATFSAGISVAVRGNKQYVEIRPQGTTDVRDVKVSLRRR